MARRLILYGCLVILTASLAFQVRLAALDSQTTDEAVHVSAGYTYLTQDDYRFNPEHPPLVKILSALPLLFLNVKQPESFAANWESAVNFHYDSWRENRRYGEALFYGAGNNPDQLLFWARIPFAILTFLLGLTIFLIAWRHWGEYAALMAVGLYATNPIVAGHGHLVTTDIALSLGFLLTVYSGWRFFHRPVLRNAIYLGLSLGLALSVKHTAVLLVPILLLLWAITAWRNRTSAPVTIGWRSIVATLVVAWVVLWASFGFHDRVVPATKTISQDIITAYAERGQTAEGISPNPTVDRIYQVIRPVLVLLPGDYVKGVLFVFIHSSNGHDSFLLGNSSRTGWWYYFPVVFGLKMPIPLLIAGIAGIYLLFRFGRKETLPVTLAAAAAAFLILAMLSKANLGVRHVLPILPILALAAGWAMANFERWRQIGAGLLVWSAVVFCLAGPNYLTYFNELAGGSNRGYKIATDSNLDWGQDLRRIARYIETNQLAQPVVEYNWLGDSALKYYLGTNFRLPSKAPLALGERLIIGGSAYNQPQYAYLRQRADCSLVTPAVFDCQINR